MSAIGIKATLEEVAAVETPEPTATWCPVSHINALDLTRENIIDMGFDVHSESYVLDKEGARLFATYDLGAEKGDGFSLQVGLRHSHDKSLPMALAFGSQVLVCSNMMFVGDKILRRKHTPGIMRDLPGLIRGALYSFRGEAEQVRERWDAYRSARMFPRDWERFLVACFREGVVAPSKFNQLDALFHEPPVTEYSGQSVNAAVQAVTDVLKGYNPFDVPMRTVKLTRIADAFAGFELN